MILVFAFFLHFFPASDLSYKMPEPNHLVACLTQQSTSETCFEYQGLSKKMNPLRDCLPVISPLCWYTFSWLSLYRKAKMASLFFWQIVVICE